MVSEGNKKGLTPIFHPLIMSSIPDLGIELVYEKSGNFLVELPKLFLWKTSLKAG